MAKLGAAPAPAAELDTRKAVLVGSFGRAVETTDGIAGILGDFIEEGVPLSELKTYSSDITGVSPEAVQAAARLFDPKGASIVVVRSEEHTSELQSLMRISYAVFCLKK